MCESTASEKIHIWFPNKDEKNHKAAEKAIKSFGTEDPEMAVTAY
jgi:hypothetical protein